MELESLAKQKSTNITWHGGKIGRPERQDLLRQRGATVWLTGLSGSGKSTIAVRTEAALLERGHLAYVLDGDNVRHGLNRNLGFSPEDRTENIRRIGEVAKLFTDTGVIVFTSFISPYRADRDAARALFENGEPLGPPHQTLESIRNEGGGRFNHWQGKLYLSSSDGSDPRTNGRRYGYRVPARWRISCARRTWLAG